MDKATKKERAIKDLPVKDEQASTLKGGIRSGEIIRLER